MSPTSVGGFPKLQPGQLLQIRRGAYDLTEAPRFWYVRARELATPVTQHPMNKVSPQNQLKKSRASFQKLPTEERGVWECPKEILVLIFLLKDAGDDAPSQRNLTCPGASVTTKGR